MGFEVKILDRVIDKYLAYPILIDIGIIATIWCFSDKLKCFEFELKDRFNQLNVISNLISSDVALAGFILAALTIIVTFKSNLQSKGMNNATAALELIFSSKHYSKIVQVFRKSLIELVLCFSFLFGFWLSSDNFSIITINRINIVGIIITILSFSRSLFILGIVLDLENHKK